jgi:hypothetical protein
MYGIVFALLLLVIAGIYFHYNEPTTKEKFTNYDGSRLLRERQDPRTMGPSNVDPLSGIAKEDCYYKFGKNTEPFVSSMTPGAPEDVKAGTLLLPYTPSQLGPSPVTKVQESEEYPAIPVGPFRSISQDAPVAFIDPANTRTKFIRVRRAYEDLVGFFNGESQMLEGTSDPTIQQPLLLAKSDLKRLEDEVNLLERNPGLEPSLTEKDMGQINANLRFLQRQSRLLNNVGEMAYSHTDTEGFQGFQGFQENEDISSMVMANSKMLEENFTDNPNNSHGPRAKVQDLVEFNTRLWAEMERLSASNTSSPIVQGRVTQMDKMRKDIQRILDEVERNDMKESDIPIFMEDIKNAYPVLSDPTKPFPELLRQTGLPPELQNLLPPGVNPSSSQTENLIMKYVAQILNNTAVDLTIGLHYKPPHYVVDNAAGATFLPENIRYASHPLGAATDEYTMMADVNYHNPQDPSGVPVEAMSVNQPMGRGRDPANPRPPSRGGGNAGHFDWESKTKQICEAIRKRGLKPGDYACLPPGAKVSKDYLWRGHAKMVCSRLDTAPEPNVAPLVGCPPNGWPGWEIGGDL